MRHINKKLPNKMFSKANPRRDIKIHIIKINTLSPKEFIKTGLVRRTQKLPGDPYICD